jgi:hypothetical protein
MWDPIPDRDNLVVEVFGPEGVGKTHFACTFPNPVVLDTEGRSHIVMRKFGLDRLKRVRSWGDLRAAVEIIIANVKPPATIVVDSASDLQDMAAEAWLHETGQAAVWPRVNWGQVRAKIDTFIDFSREKGYNVVLTERVKRVFSEKAQSYTGEMEPDRYYKTPYRVDVELELQHGLVLEGREITKRPVAKVRKAPWQHVSMIKPYLIELTYEAMRRDLFSPWRGSVDDLAAEAARLETAEAVFEQVREGAAR